MTSILLGFEQECKLAQDLNEELRKLGYETILVYSGYDVIKAAVTQKPAAILLHSNLKDYDVLRTSVWLSKDNATNEIPQFLISNDGNGQPHHFWEVNKAAETACCFSGITDAEKGVEGIIEVLQKFAESSGLCSGPNGQSPVTAPTAEQVDTELVEAFETHFIKSRLLLQLLQINRNINEVDYFAKILMEQVARLFECRLVSFLWKGDLVTEYDLITAPLNMGKFEALRQWNHKAVSDAGWGNDGPTDIITWGRDFLVDAEDEYTIDDLSKEYVKVDIVFRNQQRGRLILAEAGDKTEITDTYLIADFKRHLAPIFSNFIMYQDLEMHLIRDDRIFQSIGELAGVSTLELENFRSFMLQSLLILLDLYSTNKGAIISVNSSGEINDVATLGESEEYFTKLTSNGRSIFERALEDNCFRMYSKEPSSDDEIELIDGDKVDNVVVAPLGCSERFFGVAMLTNIRPFNTGKEKKSIDTFAKLISNHIYNKNLSDEFIEKKSIEEQLHLAREIQMGLLPDGEASNKSFDIYARSTPAKQVGGDFFDYYPIDEDMLGISIADISGKGIPASLLMSMTKSVFQSLFESEKQPAMLLSRANNILARQFFNDKFVTALFCLVTAQRMVFASGGHHPILVYRAEDDVFEKYDPDGIALGILEDPVFETAIIDFQPGDVAILFTDGLCEASNAEHDQFGYERIEAVVREKAKSGAREVVDRLFEALEEHTSGLPAFDDTTIIVLIARETDD